MSEKIKNIFVFVGPPGAGKGTLSQYCIQHLGWKQFSTGAMCRKHIHEQTDFGKQIDFAIKSGKLVSDQLIFQVVEDWLSGQKNDSHSVILDGFPRTVAQAENLQQLLTTKFLGCSLHIIRLAITSDTVLYRLASRMVCSNYECQAVYSKADGLQRCTLCSYPLSYRSDDAHDVIKDRLDTYYMHEKGLLDFFRQQRIPINEVNGERPLQTVFSEFKHLVTALV